MFKTVLLVLSVLILTACGDSAENTDTRGEGAETAGSGGIPVEGEPISPGPPVIGEIRLDVPTPIYPYDGAIMRNMISYIPPSDGIPKAEHCHEPRGLQVTFQWQGIHGGAMPYRWGDEPTATLALMGAGPFAVTGYEVCVSAAGDPKCDGSQAAKEQIFKNLPDLLLHVNAQGGKHPAQPILMQFLRKALPIAQPGTQVEYDHQRQADEQRHRPEHEQAQRQH